MTKKEIIDFTEYFGNYLPAGKIKDRETRLAIVRLYTSLAKNKKLITEEIEEARNYIIGEHQEEVNAYISMKNNADPELKKKAAEMEECIRIEMDYTQTIEQILSNEFREGTVQKVPLEVLFEALADCNFENLGIKPTLGAVNEVFASILT